MEWRFILTESDLIASFKASSNVSMSKNVIRVEKKREWSRLNSTQGFIRS